MTLTRQDKILMRITEIVMYTLAGSLTSGLWWATWDAFQNRQTFYLIMFGSLAIYWTHFLVKLIR